MIDGILLVDKERGITSYDVIRKLKKVLPKKQKIGHAGTLDPFATGLLIVLLGRGTKLMTRFLNLKKEYIVKGEFGYETDTQDSEGKIINRSDSRPVLEENINRAVIEKFTGEFEQIPPSFSAKKLEGRKAYDLARNGMEVNLKPKKITVDSFGILSYNWPFVEFRIVCSSGTYIRTLISDLGREIGTFATAVELRREKIGRFDVKEAFKSENISQNVENEIMSLDNLDLN